jgi:hypothetical protein
MTDNSWRTGAAVEAHQLLAWVIPTIEKFPRRHKFTIGDHIENTALDVLEALIDFAAPQSMSVVGTIRPFIAVQQYSRYRGLSVHSRKKW